MQSTDTDLPPNVEPLLPSQARTSIDHYVDSNIESLRGMNHEVADKISGYANLQELEICDDPFGNPLLVSDLLRVRTDQHLALHPKVCQLVPSKHHDALLDDAVSVYYDKGNLNPPLYRPEPALAALNTNSPLAYQSPEYQVRILRTTETSAGNCHESHEYPIEVHDMLADLRSKSVVTGLGQTDCPYCGLEVAQELMEQISGRGTQVNGYAGVAATSPPNNPTIVVKGYESGSMSEPELFLNVCSLARNHGIRSDVTVKKSASVHTHA